MPKNEIDYSNTIIYKIFCKNKNINEVYIGHTTNLIKRKYQHKIECKNNLNKKLNIYNTIRENGGWDNWDMLEITTYNCKNSEEARIKENEYYKLISDVSPYIDNKNKYCDICKLHCDTNNQYNLHIMSNIHKKKSHLHLKETKGDKKSSVFFQCGLCYFNTSRKSQFDRHNLTDKHKKETLELQMDYKQPFIENFICECGNEYKHRQGLWKHKKKCNYKSQNKTNTPETENDLKILTNLVLDVVKQNKELTQQNSELTNKIVDIYKTGQTNNITNSNFNSHNKTFNLNIYLNETCKDAMNITDFVDSLKLQLSDLESIGRLGYIQGISNIIVKNLKKLDVHKRPVHCSDSKREVMYIKDEDKWEKENEEKKKLRKVIKKIADKNARLLPEFKKEHPDCIKSTSKYSDQYNKLIVESMGGSGDNDSEKEDKIIRKIAKEVVIDKSFEMID